MAMADVGDAETEKRIFLYMRLLLCRRDETLVSSKGKRYVTLLSFARTRHRVAVVVVTQL